MPVTIFTHFGKVIVSLVRGAFAPACFDHRTDAIHAYLAEHDASPDVASLAAAAREAFRAVPGIEIDPLETQWRHGAKGIEVRAWCLAIDYRSAGDLIENHRTENAHSLDARTFHEVGRLPELTRLILLLRTRHGMSGAQISDRFGISRRAVKRHFMKIARTASRIGGATDRDAHKE